MGRPLYKGAEVCFGDLKRDPNVENYPAAPVGFGALGFGFQLLQYPKGPRHCYGGLLSQIIVRIANIESRHSVIYVLWILWDKVWGYEGGASADGLAAE